jgi:hypothetical protein
VNVYRVRAGLWAINGVTGTVPVSVGECFLTQQEYVPGSLARSEANTLLQTVPDMGWMTMSPGSTTICRTLRRLQFRQSPCAGMVWTGMPAVRRTFCAVVFPADSRGCRRTAEHAL